MSEVVTMELTAHEFDALTRGEDVTIVRERLAVSWGGRVLGWKKGRGENPTVNAYVCHVPYGSERRSVTLRRCRAKA